MNFKHCLEYFDAIEPPEEMTTDYIINLMEVLTNPQDKLKVIHIGGTNGKGSTTKLIETTLIKSGYKTGSFASPYLISPLEGVSINGQWIDEDTYTKAANLVIDACKVLQGKSLTHPSTYECQVATAIMCFTLEAVDFALIEVGLGGTTDGTNIFKSPLMTLITSIGLDHTEYLGTTFESIASAKAGIIKKKSPVIIGKMLTEASDTITKIASDINAPIYNLNTLTIPKATEILTTDKNINNRQYNLMQEMSFKAKLNGLNLSYTGPLRLLGNHQIANACIALTAIELLRSYDVLIEETHIKEAFETLQWPCRCDYFTFNNQSILIDGAHNIDSTKALVNTIESNIPSWDTEKTTLLFSALKDKEIEAMLQILSTVSSKIAITEIDHFRGTQKEAILKIASKYFENISLYDTPSDAYETLKNTTDTLLITGSLYMTIPMYYKYFN